MGMVVVAGWGEVKRTQGGAVEIFQGPRKSFFFFILFK
jgi:hypothetical protein